MSNYKPSSIALMNASKKRNIQNAINRKTEKENNSTQERINRALKEVRFSNASGSHCNCIRLNSSCSDEHNLEIVKRCMGYLKLGVPFYTEVIFNNGERADILLPSLDPPLIEEIMVTETKERLEAKSYPFRIVEVRV